MLPAFGEFWSTSDIAVEWFQSSSNISQLSLQFNGSTPVRTSADPVWSQDVMGNTSIKRQYSYTLFVLQRSGTSGERADTGEFLEDFTSWIDEMNVTREIPIFGNEPEEERIWATGGSKVADWEGTPPASVYAVQIHQIYTTNYESEDY